MIPQIEEFQELFDQNGNFKITDPEVFSERPMSCIFKNVGSQIHIVASIDHDIEANRFFDSDNITRIEGTLGFGAISAYNLSVASRDFNIANYKLVLNPEVVICGRDQFNILNQKINTFSFSVVDFMLFDHPFDFDFEGVKSLFCSDHFSILQKRKPLFSYSISSGEDEKNEVSIFWGETRKSFFDAIGIEEKTKTSIMFQFSFEKPVLLTQAIDDVKQFILLLTILKGSNLSVIEDMRALF